MSCNSCRSTNQSLFPSEMNIHFSGFQNLDKPTVWAFPKLLICLDCGFVESRIERAELRRLAKHPAQEPPGNHKDVRPGGDGSSRAA